MPSTAPRGRPRWVSASELAEYAYCPRAWWFRGHPPPLGPSRESQRAARSGARFHAETLDGERARERWAGRYVVLLLVALALLLLGLLGALA